ncbi:TPA: hypothetical protein NGU06_004501 [Vibrio parahaemolyticus]|nr:hypothetical protein [Vibrio parahaemolyticus]
MSSGGLANSASNSETPKGLWEHITTLFDRVVSDVFSSAATMEGTIIAAAAFGGLCLFGYRLYVFYNGFNKKLWGKEHALALLISLFSFFVLPIIAIVFAGIYGINNHVAAWQIGLTTPMLIESAYIAYVEKAKKGKYHQQYEDQPEGA